VTYRVGNHQPQNDAIFLAHVAEVEDLGWAEVLERMERWRFNGYEGDWQDARYDPADSWSWPDFGSQP
jgi:hypothetical protein